MWECFIIIIINFVFDMGYCSAVLLCLPSAGMKGNVCITTLGDKVFNKLQTNFYISYQRLLGI